jgi:hypothetical protein
MIAIFAYIIALSLYLSVAILATVYTWIKAIVIGIKQRSFKAYWGVMWGWCYGSSLGIDKAGSPLLKHLGNDLMVKPDGVRIGNPDKTLSYYLGQNKIKKKLYWFGWLVAVTVDFVALFFGDTNHTEKVAKKEKFND